MNYPDHLAQLKKEAKQHGKHDAVVWLRLAWAYANSYDRVKTKAATQQAIKVAKRVNLATVWMEVGRIQQSMDASNEALHAYTKATELSKGDPEAVLALSSYYEKLNQLDESQRWLDQLSEEVKQRPTVALQQAILSRRLKEPDKAAAIMKDLCSDKKEKLPRELLINSWHEYYRTLDALEDYPAAYQALCRSKELNQEGTGKAKVKNMRDRKREGLRRIISVLEKLTPSQIEEWRVSLSSNEIRQPSFLLGHPRSGTTLLENIIDSHSLIHSSDERPTFQTEIINPILSGFRPPKDDDEASLAFLDHLDDLPPSKISRFQRIYWQQIEAHIGQSLKDITLLDKNPAITDAIPIILRIFPEAKFIFALRDPRAVVWSSFTLPMMGTSFIGSFWFDLDSAAEAYTHLINTWFAAREKLPDSQKIEIRYEDTLEDTVQQGRKAIEFLGLEWEEQQEKFYEHAQDKVVRSPTYADVAQPIYTRAKEHWRNYAEFMGDAEKRLEPVLKRLGYE